MRVAPDPLEELIAGERPAAVLGQERQQLELLVGEPERPPASRASWPARSITSSSIFTSSSEPKAAARQSSWRTRAYSSAGTSGVSTKSSNPAETSRPGQPRQRERDQDRHLGQRAAAPNLLHRAQRPGQLVAGVDHHHRRRRRRDGALVEIAQIEPRQGHRAAEIGQRRGE
jgi:hypothetical protein